MHAKHAFAFVVCLLMAFALSGGEALAGRVAVHNNEVIVKLKPGRTASSLKGVSAKAVAKVAPMQLSQRRLEIVRLHPGEDVWQFTDRLNESGLVEYAYPNVIKQVSTLLELEAGNAYIPDDPLFFGAGNDTLEDAWENPYNNQWALLYTNAPLAWKHTTGSPSVIVAVIDTGLKFGSPELEGRLWVNTGETPDNSVDDEGDGWVDDVNGYDFTDYDPSEGQYGDGDPSDPLDPGHAHGTSVAGIIGAITNNGEGIAGVAGGGPHGSGVRLMILRVGTDVSISVAAEIAALDYAVSHGAKIINMSFGGPTGGPPEEQAVRDAWNGGAVIAAAGGNIPYGNPSGIDLPAGFPEAICVGATTIFSQRTVYEDTPIIAETVGDYSKQGPEMELAAPGTHIMTLWGASAYTTRPSWQFTGTSAATPLVSGFAALILSANPGYTNQQIRDLMRQSVVDLGDAGWDETYGYGRIDMAQAFEEPPPPPPELTGDANGDGVVNALDVDEIRSRYGAKRGESNYTESADCNGDGVIDELDIFEIGLNWGKTAE